MHATPNARQISFEALTLQIIFSDEFALRLGLAHSPITHCLLFALLARCANALRLSFSHRLMRHVGPPIFAVLRTISSWNEFAARSCGRAFTAIFLPLKLFLATLGRETEDRRLTM